MRVKLGRPSGRLFLLPFGMAYNPLNLAIRFLLEMGALFATGRYFYTEGHTLIGILIPLAMMTLWAVFAVPNDRSRSGKTVVAISGTLRLVLETAFFLLPVCLLWLQNEHLAAIIFGLVVLMHYLFSIDRIKWLLQQ